MAYVLRPALDIRTASAFSGVLVDRFFDFATVILVFVAALSVAPPVAPWAGNVTVSVLVALVLFVVGLWLAIRLCHLWTTLSDRLLSVAVPRSGGWRAMVHDLFDGVAVVDRLRAIMPVLLLPIGLRAAQSRPIGLVYARSGRQHQWQLRPSQRRTSR